MGNTGRSVLFAWLILILASLKAAEAAIKFTNIECEALDKPFADFKNCRLRVPKRGVVELNIYVRLFQVPVNNVSINLGFFKKANGYRPFMYNITTDFCKFMVNKSRFPLLKIYYEFLQRSSNINHTCPYDHDIIVTKLELNDNMFRLLPLPVQTFGGRIQ